MKKLSIICMIIILMMSVLVMALGNTFKFSTTDGDITMNTSIISGTNISCNDIVGASYSVCDGDGTTASSGLNYWLDSGTYLSPNASYGTGINSSFYMLDGKTISSWYDVNGSATVYSNTSFELNQLSKTEDLSFADYFIIGSFNGTWNNSVNYYLKTEIDTQGEMETIWGVSLANDGELIANCSGSSCDVTNTGTLDGYEAAGFLAINTSDNINDLFVDDISTDDTGGNTTKEIQDAVNETGAYYDIDVDKLDGQEGSYYLDDTTIGNCSVSGSCTDVAYDTELVNINDYWNMSNILLGWGNLTEIPQLGNISSEIATMLENTTIIRNYDKLGNTSTEIANAMDNLSIIRDGNTSWITTNQGYNTSQEIWDNAVANGTFQYDIGSNCGANNYVYGIQDDGTLLCRADVDTTNNEDTTEGYIFDLDNTADLGLGGFDIVNIGAINFTNDQPNHWIKDNSTCIVIKGDTSELRIC